MPDNPTFAAPVFEMPMDASTNDDQLQQKTHQLEYHTTSAIPLPVFFPPSSPEGPPDADIIDQFLPENSKDLTPSTSSLNICPRSPNSPPPPEYNDINSPGISSEDDEESEDEETKKFLAVRQTAIELCGGEQVWKTLDCSARTSWISRSKELLE
jgi:hypothetical protein